jgi:hypothetical protein
VIDTERAHPLIVLAGSWLPHPFFGPPHVFLREIRVGRRRQTMPPAGTG